MQHLLRMIEDFALRDSPEMVEAYKPKWKEVRRLYGALFKPDEDIRWDD
jgi:hypothetical protein